MPGAKDFESVEALLAALIAVPSVNPEGGTGTGAENCGELRIAEYVGGILESLGARVRLDEVEPGRPNVIGEFPGAAEKPAVLLGPHLDTVGVGGMSVDPFGGEIRDGKLHGRGACDTKGSMAAMLWALREIGPGGIAALDLGVTFAGFMGEETGQPGSRHFARANAGRYDLAVVGEPTGCDIVYKHKGTLWAEIAASGVAAHGSTPERGESAISKIAAALLDLEGDFREQLAGGGFTDPVLGEPTINIGRIRGGTRSNIVPEHCAMAIDMRVTPALGVDAAARLLGEFLAGSGHAELQVRQKLRCEPLDTPLENPLVRRLLALPGTPEPVGAPWFCDAAVLSTEGNIPAVAAGPGDIAQAHTADEWIEVAALRRGAEFYRDFLLGRRRN